MQTRATNLPPIPLTPAPGPSVLVGETTSIQIERIRREAFGAESYRLTHKVSGATFLVPKYEMTSIVNKLQAMMAEPFPTN